MRTQLRTFGLELDSELKAQAQALDGFVRFVDDEYFEVEMSEAPTDKDFVYFKRENGQKLVG
ncbi:MAG: hypothetical protein ACR2M7_02510 [Bdellovibrionales bacterium]